MEGQIKFGNIGYEDRVEILSQGNIIRRPKGFLAEFIERDPSDILKSHRNLQDSPSLHRKGLWLSLIPSSVSKEVFIELLVSIRPRAHVEHGAFRENPAFPIINPPI